MREKPKHDRVSFNSKHSNHQTHRCFYINEKCQFAFLIDEETDIEAILDKFLREKDFIFLKEYIEPEWDHIGFVDYFPETNEIFLTTDKKSKNIILQDVSTNSLSKETRKRLLEERKIKEDADEKKYKEEMVKREAAEAEKARKRVEKFDRKKKKEEHLAKKTAKKLAKLEKGVSVAAGGLTIEQFEEKIKKRDQVKTKVENVAIGVDLNEEVQTPLEREVTESCGNVFEDLGLPNAKELLEECDRKWAEEKKKKRPRSLV